MEIRVLLFLVFLPLIALSQDTWDWLNIDGGSEISYDARNGLEWKTDEDFISTGKNKMVSISSYNSLGRLNTLRADNISVCLARTHDNQFPFISSLELWPMDDDMYEGMSRDLAWHQSYRVPELYSFSGQYSSTLNVELQPTANSTLPPSISAIEVYTASDPLATIGTSEDDSDGLASLVSSLEQLEGWSGDPCPPNNTVWQWLGCSGNDPPRVTSLNISGYGLDGPLPDFSKMEVMETMSGIQQSGWSHSRFLGNLPHLRVFNVRDNSFSGEIPESVTKSKKKKKIRSPSPKEEEKRGALVIGLAVGIPLGLTAVYFLVRRKPTPSPKKPEANAEAPARPTGENIPVGNAGKTDQASLGNGQTMPGPTGQHIPVRNGSGGIDHPPEVPIRDREELYEPKTT
ncbi:putative LRR receptor-like serine/threonine-protein kinase [Vitis vinifera]|uniref:Putative LRR receptor-like serine/threonine-protein kinase n=1 Tax=Vitis vinifera TaxID=29760 RepID=A0A438FAS0_VITVI|nr:putative LRR receptor-like serine/threonine-protein kinase [Vitis vinifera]